MKNTMRSTITADRFLESINIAFANTLSFGEPVRRTRARYSRCGPGTIHCKSNHGYVSFYEYIDGRQISLLKTGTRVYELSRKRYLGLLLKLLESFNMQRCPGSTKMASRNLRTLIDERERLLQKFSSLIHTFENGNLDLARIVLTQKQYSWYTRSFRQKMLRISENANNGYQGKQIFHTKNNVITRSKSECNIGNGLEDYGVCYHYEEQMQLYVKTLVGQLADSVRGYSRKNGLALHERLYSYRNGVCWWNVPDVYQWMNSPGSIWKTYNSSTGKVTMYNDFTIMLADDSLMKWEHEGILEDFMYRQNAKERASLLVSTGSIDRKNLIETYEDEANDVERLIDIIKRDVLPRLWY